MEFLTNDKLTIVGAAGMIGSNMAQTALMMRLTPNICLYDPYAPALEGVAEELYHCAFEGVTSLGRAISRRLLRTLRMSFRRAARRARRA